MNYSVCQRCRTKSSIIKFMTITYCPYMFEVHILNNFVIFNQVWLLRKKKRKENLGIAASTGCPSAGLLWKPATFWPILGTTKSRMSVLLQFLRLQVLLFTLCLIKISCVCVCDQLRLLQSPPVTEESTCCLIPGRPGRYGARRQSCKSAVLHWYGPTAGL